MNQEKTSLKMFLTGLGGVLIAAIIITAGVGITRVYAFNKIDTFTVTVAKVLRLPIMKIDGQRVLYSDYAEDMGAIKKMKDYNTQMGSDTSELTPEKMSDQVLWRLANNILIDEAALAYGVKVEDADIKELKDQILQQFETIEAADKELKDRYGWDLDTYTGKVIKPYVLSGKVGEKISADIEAREEIRNKAQNVLDQIKAGADFATMAKQYGEDGTKDNGGSLGFFAEGDMVPEFENVAFALKKGELSQALVETEFGYHIIKVDDIKTEKEKNASGKMVNVKKVSASHILFRFPSIDTFLDTLAKKANIHLYVKVHDPFKEIIPTTAE